MKAHRGVEKYSSTLSLTSALEGVCGQPHAPAALTLGKRRGANCIGGWVCSSASPDGCPKISPPTGIRSPGREKCITM